MKMQPLLNRLFLFLAVIAYPSGAWALRCEDMLRGKAQIEPIELSGKIIFYVSINGGPFAKCETYDPTKDVCAGKIFQRGAEVIFDSQGSRFPLEYVSSSATEYECMIQDGVATQFEAEYTQRSLDFSPGLDVRIRRVLSTDYRIMIPKF